MESRRTHSFFSLLAVVVTVFVLTLVALSGSAAAHEDEEEYRSEKVQIVATSETDQADSADVGHDEVVIVGEPEELPPGWCYKDTIGTYPCHFQIKLPFDFDVDDGCPEGYVLDRATGKCINDQLTVPEPVPADRESSAVVQTRVVEFDPDVFGCPEGWVQATPPLNWQLGCIPNTIVAEQPGD